MGQKRIVKSYGIGIDASVDDPKSQELRKIMTKRLETQGWENVKHFATASGVPYSLETVRRAFNTCEYKSMETSTLAIIMHFLDYSPSEIKTLLRAYTDDPYLIMLIGDQDGPKYSGSEKAVIEAMRVITSANPALSHTLADQIDLVGRLAGVNIRSKTELLRRG